LRAQALQPPWQGLLTDALSVTLEPLSHQQRCFLAHPVTEYTSKDSTQLSFSKKEECYKTIAKKSVTKPLQGQHPAVTQQQYPTPARNTPDNSISTGLPVLHKHPAAT
jgi:hypothetical protein